MECPSFTKGCVLHYPEFSWRQPLIFLITPTHLRHKLIVQKFKDQVIKFHNKSWLQIPHRQGGVTNSQEMILLTWLSAYVAWFSTTYGRPLAHSSLILFLDSTMDGRAALLEKMFSFSSPISYRGGTRFQFIVYDGHTSVNCSNIKQSLTICRATGESLGFSQYVSFLTLLYTNYRKQDIQFKDSPSRIRTLR